MKRVRDIEFTMDQAERDCHWSVKNLVWRIELEEDTSTCHVILKATRQAYVDESSQMRRINLIFFLPSAFLLSYWQMPRKRLGKKLPDEDEVLRTLQQDGERK